jgi:tetratricopeptide (TPR) repeat protein
MKKVLMISSGLLLFAFTKAQNIDEAQKQMYYQRYGSATNTLHAVLQKEPSNANSWYLLTDAYAQQNKLDKLKDSLALAPAGISEEPYFQVAKGYLLLQQGNKDAAKQLFDAALDKTKEKDAAILSAVAKAHIDTKAGDANYAIELLNKAAKRDKRNPQIYTLIGNAYRKLDNATEAFKAYQKALEQDKNYAAAIHQMGNIFVTQKNPEMYLKYFNDALATDPEYAPAYYSLYIHYYVTDPARAMDNFNKYVVKSDPSAKNEYLHTDLLYLNKQHEAAIAKAEQLLQKANAEPRLYKLIAYSKLDMKDTAAAMEYMQRYFNQSPDSNYVVKDFETMGLLYASTADKMDSAAKYYEKAASMQTDSASLFAYYKRLAGLYEDKKDYAGQALWLGKYYESNKDASNIDLFNWGIAHYRAEQWQDADSVFGKYIQKYPDQTFGYYWRARSNAAVDFAIEKGTAIPHYLKLVEMAEKDLTNANNKKWLVEAYGYLAMYEANTEKNYVAAIDYFKKLKTVDPENKDADKYISKLEKSAAANNGTSAKNATSASSEKNDL